MARGVKRHREELAWVDLFLAALPKNQGNATQAAKAAGVSRARAYAYRAEHPEFRALWDAAYEEGIDEAEHMLYLAGTTGLPTTTTTTKKDKDGNVVEVTERHSWDRHIAALIVFLKGARPEKYRDSVKVEQSGSVEVTMSEKEIASVDREIVRIMDELGPRREAKASRKASGGAVEGESPTGTTPS